MKEKWLAEGKCVMRFARDQACLRQPETTVRVEKEVESEKDTKQLEANEIGEGDSPLR